MGGDLKISLGKFIFLSFLIIMISIPLNSIERQQRYTKIENLSKPNTVDYVPVPFPKTEEEIIENITYKFNKESGGLKGIFKFRRFSTSRKFQLAFIAGLLKVSRIIKAVNYCSRLSNEYDYIIEIENSSGKVKQILKMRDDGRVGMSTQGNLKANIPKIPSDNEIYKDLEKCDLNIIPGDVKKLEWISAYAQHVAGFRLPFYPFQKLTLNDGRIFYKIHKKIYKVIKVHKIGENTSYKTFREFRRDDPRRQLIDYSVLDYVEEVSLL